MLFKLIVFYFCNCQKPHHNTILKAQLLGSVTFFCFCFQHMIRKLPNSDTNGSIIVSNHSPHNSKTKHGGSDTL